MHTHKIKSFILAIFLTYISIYFQSAYACSRILDVVDDQAVIVARTLDWPQYLPLTLWIYPAGIQRKGLAQHNPITWVSKYGSIVSTPTGDPIVGDGMNERGFAAHVLWLTQADYGVRNDNVPGLSASLWVQYYLDNFQTVDEAVRFTASTPLQIVPYYYQRFSRWLTLHIALEDATGDSAIIEYINGTMHIYHDKNTTVLTNEPSYDAQLANITKYAGLGGDLPLPGTVSSEDRFARASYEAKYLPHPQSTQEEISQVLSILHNVSQPFNLAGPQVPIPSFTWWSMVSDLTHKVYYFNSTIGMNTDWVNLAKFNLKPGASIMKLDLANPSLVGEVSADFRACGFAWD